MISVDQWVQSIFLFSGIGIKDEDLVGRPGFTEIEASSISRPVIGPAFGLGARYEG